MMSHEIRTPLNAVLGLLDVFSDSHLSEEQSIWLQQMDKSAQLLLTIINDVLDLSKIESGGFSLQAENMDPRESIHVVFNQFKEIANKKQIQLIQSVSPEVPSLIYQDENRFAQILLNLVGNAIKFTEQGHITVSMYYHNKHLYIDVKDTGIGIEKNKIKNIFKPFIQADGSITRKYGGTGLGLSICKKIVTLMCGQIKVESEIGQGTCFTVRIPLLPLKQSSIIQRNNQSTDTMKPLDILIAEDSKANQMVLKIILEKAGHRVTVADNGQEAVNIIEQQQIPFSLVLMDMSMPILCGIEATKQLRKIISISLSSQLLQMQ